MKTYILILLLASLMLTTACENNIQKLGEKPTSPGEIEYKLSDSEANSLKYDFALALAKSLKDSPKLRSIIKNKSLERFDEDYDVLYHMIKTDLVEKGLTVRDLIELNYKDKRKLSEIENKIKTLTIFVPTLPGNSFSPDLWDVKNQVPVVAIKLNKSNDVPIIDAEGNESLVEAKYVPGFPVLVIKDNLRVLDNSNQRYGRRAASDKNQTRLVSNDGIQFEFLSDAFDRKQNQLKERTQRLTDINEFDYKVRDARVMFQNTDYWHRDYIYYNLSQTQDKGPFDYDFSETITSFSLNPNEPVACYNYISDGSDEPKYGHISSSSVQNTFWTSGSFTFRFKFLVNSKNGTGVELEKFVPLSPDKIFKINWTKIPTRNLYQPTGIECITADLRIPVIKWDLNQYATAIKVTVEEVDSNISHTIQEQVVSKFAANFGIDAGEEKKFGMKFGATASEDKIITYTRSYTDGNDLLGDVTVYFQDKVCTALEVMPNNYYGLRTQEYHGGYYIMSLEPTKVQ